MGLPQAELDIRIKAVLSTSVLRNRAAEWLDAAVDRVAETGPDGSNVISRAWKRIYFDPARDPALLAKAKAWRAAKVAAAAAVAEAAAAAAQQKAVADAIAASAAAGLGAADAAAAVIAVQHALPLQSSPPVELGPPPELLASVAQLESALHSEQVPKPAKPWRNKSGKTRGASTRQRISNAARVAAAYRDQEESDREASDAGEMEREPDHDAESSAAAPGRKRLPPSRPVVGGGGDAAAKARGGARLALARPAASRSGGEDQSSGSDDDDDGAAGDSSSTDVSVARARTQRGRAVNAPLGKGRSMAGAAAATADSDSDGDPGPRSRAANEIPWLWARVQEHITAGRAAAAERAWVKVKVKATQVLMEYEGEHAHVAYWTSKLTKMTAKYASGGVAVLSYTLK